MLMMLPFEAPTIFEGIHKSYFQMPRVVKNQRHKFENEELFRQLSHESTVRYTGFKDRPLEERQMKFLGNCHEGHTEVSVIQSGIQFTLMFNPTANPAFNSEGCDFDKEQGKVHIKSGFILDGVCVIWRGWIDLQRLEGFGCLLFDDYRAYLEDEMLKQKASCNNNVGHPNNFHHMLPNPLPTLGLPDAPSLAGPSIAYGKSAIAAAAAAAFHQALGVGPPPQLQQLQQQQQQQQQQQHQQQQLPPPPPRTLGPQALQRLGPISAAAVNSGPMTGVLPN